MKKRALGITWAARRSDLYENPCGIQQRASQVPRTETRRRRCDTVHGGEGNALHRGYSGGDRGAVERNMIYRRAGLFYCGKAPATAQRQRLPSADSGRAGSALVREGIAPKGCRRSSGRKNPAYSAPLAEARNTGTPIRESARIPPRSEERPLTPPHRGAGTSFYI